MDWYEDWRAISIRIGAYLDAAKLFFASVPVEGSDFHAVSNTSFIPNAKNLKERIQEFVKLYSDELPQSALDASNHFLSIFKPGRYNGIAGVQGSSLFLAEFKSEFELSIAGSAEYAKSLVEWAFIHLQRTLVVDKDVGRKWNEAFSSGELSCERLGAVHLLSHGIWAFKAHAIGERTDLILGEPINFNDVKVTKSVLVLTEWKTVGSQGEIESKSKKAKKQAERYGVGSLAGFELATNRYIILVSRKNLMPPQDIKDGQLLYRHINIAVEPDPPSVS